MPSQLCKHRQVPGQDDYPRQAELAVSDYELSSASVSRVVHLRRPRLPDHDPVHYQAVPVPPVTACVEPEEILIADARSKLTPAQMVERKLMALLRHVGPGVSLQRSDRPAAVRRRPSSCLSGATSSTDQARLVSRGLADQLENSPSANDESELSW